METTWIVGLDGSEGSLSALRWAVARERCAGGRVAPVAAWHVPLPIWLMSGRRAVDVDRAGIAAEIAVACRDALCELPAEANVEDELIVEGHAETVLLDHAGPDSVIVVGRRGVGKVRHRVLGSVSRHVATHAASPVVVVPEGWDEPRLRRIVVGFDGSEPAAAALSWALSMAPADATVEAVIGLDVIPWLHPDAVVERHPEAIEHARHRIEETLDAVDADRRVVKSFVLDGPRHALGEAMVDADLVVVGPRGLGGIASALLGSVTAWLLHEASCPVAVVPSSA